LERGHCRVAPAAITRKVNHARPISVLNSGGKGIAMAGDEYGTEGNGPDYSKRTTILYIVSAIIVIVAIGWMLSSFDYEAYSPRSDWAFEMVQLDDANGQGYTGQNVRLAIIDTGIDPDHPSLDDANIVEWMDLVNGRTEPYDDDGHGTAMASIIAGNDPINGGAQDVDLIIVKVLDDMGESTDSMVADGIMFSLDPNGDGEYSDRADVISMSLGGRMSYIGNIIGTETKTAVEMATSYGVLMVAAAGNDGESDDGDVANPGWLPDVICVGAVAEDGTIGAFSSRGRNIFKVDPNKKPEVVAPGVDVVSAWKNERYVTASGTSQATAFVSACLAVMLSAVPELKHTGPSGGTDYAVALVKTKLMETSMPQAGQGTPHDNYYGYGLIQTMDLIDAIKVEV